MSFHIPLIPAKAGTQCFGRLDVDQGACGDVRRRVMRKNWVPAFAGMSGKEGA